LHTQRTYLSKIFALLTLGENYTYHKMSSKLFQKNYFFIFRALQYSEVAYLRIIVQLMRIA